MSRRRGARKGAKFGARGWLVTLIAALSAAGGACGLERLLEGGNDRGNIGTEPGPATTTTGPKKKPDAGRTDTPPPPAPGPQQNVPDSVHLTLGMPTDINGGDDYLMLKPQYALSYNKNRNVANWVSWQLDASWFGDAPRFKGKFIADDSLPSGFYRVRHEDYVNSGYDRGHMVRSEERTRSPEDNKATFLLTNILPQYHDLNAGPWLRLEEYAQSLAQKEKKQLYVMAGGIFPSRPETIGKGVAVPSSCFKIIAVLERGQGPMAVSESTRVIGVIMPNKTGILDEGWGKYRVSVDEIEKKTGYDFLGRVPEPVQRVIESRVDSGPTD